MNTYQQRGSITFNILLVLLLAVIAGLAYMLISTTGPRNGRTRGTNTPTHNIPTDNTINTNTNTTYNGEFNDGLGRAISTTEYPLDDIGAGLARVDVFKHDINNDGLPDRITRSRTETGTAHFVYEYKIELNTGNGFTDITPDNFNTVEGAQCALQKLRFKFIPTFQVIKISRPWQDTWTTPTLATQDIFDIKNNRIQHSASKKLKSVCDVAELF